MRARPGALRSGKVRSDLAPRLRPALIATLTRHSVIEEVVPPSEGAIFSTYRNNATTYSNFDPWLFIAKKGNVQDQINVY